MDAAVHLKHLVFHGRGGLWSQPREVIAVVEGIGGWSVFGPDAPPCSRPWRRDPLWLCILLAGCLLLLSGCAGVPRRGAPVVDYAKADVPGFPRDIRWSGATRRDFEARSSRLLRQVQAAAAGGPVNVLVLSGGGALLRNMDKLLTQVTGVACYVAENPLYCVAKGTGLALEHLDFFRRSLVAVR